jgi:hypothetical protein
MRASIVFIVGAIFGICAAIGLQPYTQNPAIIYTGEGGSITFCDGGAFEIKAEPRYQPRIYIRCRKVPDSVLRLDGGTNGVLQNLTVIYPSIEVVN